MQHKSFFFWLLLLLLIPLLADAYNESEGTAFLKGIRSFVLGAYVVVIVPVSLVIWLGLSKWTKLGRTWKLFFKALLILGHMVFALFIALLSVLVAK